MAKTFSIGQLSTLTGCKVTTIRYYEEIGILPEAWRTEGNQRRYNESHRQRLAFICHARALGFNQDEVKQLIELQFSTDNPKHCAHEIAQHHLEAVQVKIKQLQALADELSSMVDCCNRGEEHRCRVLEVLSDHRLCHGEH